MIPIDSAADSLRIARARSIVRVKFMGMPPAPRRGGLHRFISRVIGCLVAARP
jgi:hypothetical protein